MMPASLPDLLTNDDWLTIYAYVELHLYNLPMLSASASHVKVEFFSSLSLAQIFIVARIPES